MWTSNKFLRESTVPASVSNCKKNLAQTIVTKHQLKFASQFYSMNLGSVDEEGPSSYSKLSELSISFSDSLIKQPNFLNITTRKVNWVNKNDSTYKPNMVLCTNEHNYEPVFGLIKFIFIEDDNTPFLIYQKLKTIFREHEYAYEVVNMLPVCSIVSRDKLLNFKPLSLASNGDKTFIILRHCV